jgi:hypothetical protein
MGSASSVADVTHEVEVGAEFLLNGTDQRERDVRMHAPLVEFVEDDGRDPLERRIVGRHFVSTPSVTTWTRV